MAIDLSTPAGFARATTSNAAGLVKDAQSLADFGLDQTQWDLKEGSFIPLEGPPIIFHIFHSVKGYKAAMSTATDTLGRRKQVYKLPYVDGQTTDDLGREGGTFEFDVLIHGTQYKKGLSEINRLINQSTPGSLIHPILGDIRAVIKDVQQVSEANSRKAMRIRLVFIEHSYGLLGLQAEKRNKVLDSISSALSSALETINKVDNTIAKIQATILFAQVLKAGILFKLGNFKKSYALLLSQLNLTFNKSGARSIPSLVPVQQGGNLNPDGTISSSPTSVASAIATTTTSTTTGQTIGAVTALESVNKANVVRGQIQSIIDDMSTGQGSVAFYDDILSLKQAGIDLQKAVESAIASSNAQVKNYTTPRLMSIREVAFANGLSVDRVDEIQLLNRNLTSVNYIEKGTLVVVPSS